MGSFQRLQIVIVAVVLCSGCGPSVTFEQPLVDPTLAPVCPDLFGVYPLGKDDEGREMFFSISSAGAGSPKGFMRFDFLVSAVDGRVEVANYSQLAFCAKRGDDYYYHLPFKKLQPDKNLPPGDDRRYFQENWSVEETAGYEIEAWTMNEDGMLSKWSSLDGEFLAEEIEAGHLRGTIEYDEPRRAQGVVNDIQSVHVTATRDELWRFLEFVKKHKIRKKLDDGPGRFQKLQLSAGGEE